MLIRVEQVCEFSTTNTYLTEATREREEGTSSVVGSETALSPPTFSSDCVSSDGRVPSCTPAGGTAVLCSVSEVGGCISEEGVSNGGELEEEVPSGAPSVAMMWGGAQL